MIFVLNFYRRFVNFKIKIKNNRFINYLDNNQSKIEQNIFIPFIQWVNCFFFKKLNFQTWKFSFLNSKLLVISSSSDLNRPWYELSKDEYTALALLGSIGCLGSISIKPISRMQFLPLSVLSSMSLYQLAKIHKQVHLNIDSFLIQFSIF